MTEPRGAMPMSTASTTHGRIVAAPVPRGRLGLLALGGVALLAGLTGALALLGIPLPGGAGRLAAGHGLLMTLGFLGTAIGLERAVALGRPWAYGAPLATGLGALGMVVGAPTGVAAVLLAVGGGLFAGMYVAFDRIERSLHTAVQGLGAVAWLVAGVSLLVGRPVADVVPWLAAFLVLTITGERLELSRVGRLSPAARRRFVVVAAVFCGGIVSTLALPDLGTRVAGVGLLGLAAWLARHDIARRTVRMSGVTRFVALSLLMGYVWLALSGAGWLAFGAAGPGPARDALLHSLFLGFVISMVFGHAPVIVPAVLRVPLPYRPRFYVHLVLLHAGLVVRVLGGDVLGSRESWAFGGILDVTALLLFVGSSAATAIGAAAQRHRMEALGQRHR